MLFQIAAAWQSCIKNSQDIWGISTGGSALHSHCRGHRFESGMLHHLRTLILIQYQRPFFCQKTPNNKGFPAIRPFQTEVPVAGFFYLHPIATRVFLHDSFWCRVNLHDCSRETCIFTRFSRVLCKNTRFISTVITPSLYGAYHVAYKEHQIILERLFS